jgi:hypothetical protein
MFQKELYNGTPNVTVWRVLRKRLHVEAYKLSIVQGTEYHRRGYFLKHPAVPVEVTLNRNYPR